MLTKLIGSVWNNYTESKIHGSWLWSVLAEAAFSYGISSPLATPHSRSYEVEGWQDFN